MKCLLSKSTPPTNVEQSTPLIGKDKEKQLECSQQRNRAYFFRKFNRPKLMENNVRSSSGPSFLA